jgi:dienelactone hydrolase
VADFPSTIKQIWVMKKYQIILCILFFIASADAIGQNIYYFKSGLMARVPSRYGREALYQDELAYRLYTNMLTRPVEGAEYGTANGQPVKWMPVTADSLNRLRAAGGGGGFGFGRGGGSYIYLTYSSPKEQAALLNVRGNSGVYVNGEPHMGDAYSSGWLYIPVKLKKGLNEFYVRGFGAVASLTFPSAPVSLNKEDLTVPHVVLNQQAGKLQAALVVLNTTVKELKGLQLRSTLQGKEAITEVPVIPSMSSRKVAFDFDAGALSNTGAYKCEISLTDGKKTLDTTSITIDAVTPASKYSTTFTSDIDGSLQYYAVAPQVNGKPGSALFLSVHGAGVEAIGQARAYQSKDWGTLVAATNRRPRGFNWEDWGRLDALEVLNLAKNRFKPDEKRIYLTGHSMGGHGTWFLGATYPDKWAAIAPCAGYPTLKGYGSADGLIPDSATSAIEQMLLRSSNQSDVIKLTTNYKPLGVYVFHGDADRTVSVNYARQMRKLLGEFHPDLSYYEYPGGSHWFGDHSVDWKPIFDFFKWHTILDDSAVNNIDFMTSNPGISSAYRWASIHQQQKPLEYTRLQLSRNIAAGTIKGTTENAKLLKFELKDFKPGTAVKISLDNQADISYITRSQQDSIFLVKENDKWAVGAKAGMDQKGPHRYGTFKDAFNHRMVFVYGTSGTKEENEWSFNKARYDAETWYYRGNGAVDMIADKDYSIEKYKDRGVILFGNRNTNKAWDLLLNNCPIQVSRNQVVVGDKNWKGDDLAAYFVWPNQHSTVASVGVITGTGVKGMKAANANQYFAGASGFPDFMVYGLGMLQSGITEVKLAGFFDNSWKLDPSLFVDNNLTAGLIQNP